jgi:2-methylisocitrate lyase-like PEP mutase family enzyme
VTSETSSDDRNAIETVLRLGTGVAGGRARLRRLVESQQPFIVPGVTDAMGALLAQQAGFSVGYVTGAGLANAQYGIPDIGLLGLPDLVDHVNRLTGAVGIPLIVDIDTGFGGPLTAVRAIRALERAGAAAVQIEDQEMPKRCGHFDSHTVIPTGHMQSKISAVVGAREDENLLVIARTDACGVYGIDDAIERAKAYREAGADAIFVEAPRTVAELELVGQELAGVPLVVNVVEGGKTPQLSLAEYDKLGFTIVLYANFLMRSMMKAGRDALQHLREHGETASLADRMATWEERQGLFRLPEHTTAEALFDRPWQPAPATPHE